MVVGFLISDLRRVKAARFQFQVEGVRPIRIRSLPVFCFLQLILASKAQHRTSLARILVGLQGAAGDNGHLLNLLLDLVEAEAACDAAQMRELRFTDLLCNMRFAVCRAERGQDLLLRVEVITELDVAAVLQVLLDDLMGFDENVHLPPGLVDHLQQNLLLQLVLVLDLLRNLLLLGLNHLN